MAENESMWRNLTSLVDRKRLSSAQWRLAVLGLMLGSVWAATGPVSALTLDGEEKTETLADKPGPLEL
ncbi:MAG: hypothetical protein AAFY83_13920, partial [Pseudomonadota bacterium]